LAPAARRGTIVTTQRDKEARPAPDLADRDFTAFRPNQLWVADITFVPTASGFLYLALVLDAWSRKIVGWSMATYLRTELVLDALEMAIGQRRPDGVIHHSDQGSQYTSLAFGKRCKEAGVRPPRRRVRRRTYYRAEEEEEVGADLCGSAGLFGCVHCLYRRDPPASVQRRPIRLLHDEHRPDFPPDRLRVDTVVVDDVAMIGRRYEQGGGGWIRDVRHPGEWDGKIN
jgi:transposase InsO family protein